MSRQVSFTKYEKELLPDFRQKINLAETSGDVKALYARTILEFLDKAFDGELSLEFEDIALQPDNDDKFVLSDRLLASPAFTDIWNHSDLPNVLARFTETAINRFVRLEKHPEKTEAKIRTPK
jgi:hypothetical protein